jgi:hypothetical protein
MEKINLQYDIVENGLSLANTAILRFQKGKSRAGLGRRAGHNVFRNHAEHADPNRKNLNFEFDTGKKGSMVQRLNARLKGVKTRKDSVLYLEILMTKSRNVDDEEAWARASVEWLYKELGGGGKENCLSAVYHGDEKTGHLHVIWTPITTDGRLSATDYIGNKKLLIQMQDSYYEHVKKFGLSRGKRGSTARHIPPRVLRAQLNALKELETVKLELAEEKQKTARLLNAKEHRLDPVEMEMRRQLIEKAKNERSQPSPRQSFSNLGKGGPAK